jgi:hypothetical protein
LLLLVGILINHNNKAIKIGPQEDVGRTAFHAASYGRRSGSMKEFLTTIAWVTVLAFSIWIGLSAAIDLHYGEALLPVILLIVFFVFITAYFLSAKVKQVRLFLWGRLLSISSILSVLSVYLVSIVTDGFSCQFSCPGIINSYLGYACGEWSRGCIAEWFILFILAFTILLKLISALGPNKALKGDADKSGAH